MDKKPDLRNSEPKDAASTKPEIPATLSLGGKLDLDKITQHPTPTEQVESPAPYLFIAKPKDYKKGSKRIYTAATAPRDFARPQLHDATHYTDRFGINVEVVRIIKGPKYQKGLAGTRLLNTSKVDAANPEQDLSIALNLIISLGEFAHHDNKALTHFVQMDLALEHPYVVFFGSNLHVDRGNHPSPSPYEWLDVGAHSSWPHKGFKTLDEAIDYAKKFTKP